MLRVKGYNCYLVIADEYSRHLLILLFANKEPPIDIVNSFLATYGLKSGLRRVRTDQCRELDKSATFKEYIALVYYNSESIGVGASFQNAIV